MNKLLALLLLSPLVFAENETWEYYFCDENNPLRSKWGMQRRIGTVANPTIYNPKEDSREYYYFMYSTYPIPSGYVPILEETKDEIYLSGIYDAYYTNSNEMESFSLIINKKDISIKGVISSNNKKEPLTFTSKCRIF